MSHTWDFSNFSPCKTQNFYKTIMVGGGCHKEKSVWICLKYIIEECWKYGKWPVQTRLHSTTTPYYSCLFKVFPNISIMSTFWTIFIQCKYAHVQQRPQIIHDLYRCNKEFQFLFSIYFSECLLWKLHASSDASCCIAVTVASSFHFLSVFTRYNLFPEEQLPEHE